MPEVTAEVVSNGIDVIEHAVIEPDADGLPYAVYVHGFGMISVGWHPVHRAYMALLRPEWDGGVPVVDRWMPVQDHPDGSIEVRLIGTLGNPIGMALWVRGLPRFPPWYCLGCHAQYGTSEQTPCEVCGQSLRFQIPDDPGPVS
jgi:hypothetical protein